MTLYAGERVVITHTATYQAVALTNADVTVYISIDDPTSASPSSVLHASSAREDAEAMDWDAVDERWEYEWDTTGIEAGTYRAKVMIDDDNWEYINIKLKEDA